MDFSILIKRVQIWGLGYSSVLEQLSSTCMALGLIPCTAKNKKREESKIKGDFENHIANMCLGFSQLASRERGMS